MKEVAKIGLTKFISENYFRKDLNVVHIPEFYTEGEAIRNLITPSRVVIGCVHHDTDVLNKLKCYYYYVDDDKVFITDSTSSELTKIANNFMLAQRIATINAIDIIASEHGANILDVSGILKMDRRLGNYYLSPSAGYGGTGLEKGVKNITSMSMNRAVQNYFDSVRKINDIHIYDIVERIGDNKHVLFLGYGYKEFVNNESESVTQKVIDYLPDSVTYDIYDTHIDKYSNMPTGKYDMVVLMLNETEYIKIARRYPIENIIDTKYIMQK